MSNAIGLLFLHGHITNLALVRALTTPTTTAANADPRFPGSTPALPEAIVLHDAAESRRAHQPLSYLEADHIGAAPGADGYRHGFGNRVASERAWRPRWQRGPGDTGRGRALVIARREQALQCASACACG